MKSILKVILAGMSIAVLASPVTAQSLITRPFVEQYVEPPTDYVIHDPHRSVAHAHRPHEPVGHRGGHNPL
jgi:hypothetical protein